jgi:hypothetical protein
MHGSCHGEFHFDFVEHNFCRQKSGGDKCKKRRQPNGQRDALPVTSTSIFGQRGCRLKRAPSTGSELQPRLTQCCGVGLIDLEMIVGFHACLTEWRGRVFGQPGGFAAGPGERLAEPAAAQRTSDL